MTKKEVKFYMKYNHKDKYDIYLKYLNYFALCQLAALVVKAQGRKKNGAKCYSLYFLEFLFLLLVFDIQDSLVSPKGMVEV